MPAPERTTLDQIVTAAREILEAQGPDRLTMQAVAARVGVRAPSLYKRLANRDALLSLVADATVRDLGRRFEAASPDQPGDPRATAAAYATTMRSFAAAQPASYGLVFASRSDGVRPLLQGLIDVTEPLLRAMEALTGPADALNAARLCTAWAHGFISMELAGAFELGGDVDDAFEYGLARLIDSLSPPRP